MPTFRRRGRGWRAEVVRAGVRESKTFSTKARAEAWAKERDSELLSIKRGEPVRKPFRDALTLYADTVAPTHRGARWERLRLALIAKTPLGAVMIPDLRAAHVAAWRDKRLTEVSSASVAREFNLLRSVFEIARREWGWLAVNPAKDVRRPPGSPRRTRRVSAREAERLVAALGWDAFSAPENLSQRAAAVFLFAIETGMRAGEIVGLTWDRMRDKVATLPRTKNGEQREVPLSAEARRIVALMPRDGETVFGIGSAMLDALFRKAKKRAKVEGLRFHDTRAEACTRLAKRLDVLELARMIGHRDLKSLMVYYRATADELADKLG